MNVPSQTLYINNINEKVKNDVLKKMFIMIFSQYGKVIGINKSFIHVNSSSTNLIIFQI